MSSARTSERQMAVSKMLLVDMLAGRPEIHSHHQKTADCSQGPVPRVCFGDRPEMKMHRGRKKPVCNTPLPVNCEVWKVGEMIRLAF